MERGGKRHCQGVTRTRLDHLENGRYGAIAATAVAVIRRMVRAGRIVTSGRRC